MPQFRKKPIVIEAVQWTGNELLGGMPFWLVKAFEAMDVCRNGDQVLINTLEGRMTASPGDWIIKGLRGELYPCKPDIFEATYEPA